MKWLLWLPFFCYAVANPEFRPSQAPFISGDSFRSYADFAYDDIDSSLNPVDVTWGSTIFVKADDPYLEDFFAKIHPFILSKYILITHNTDAPAPGRFSAYLDDDKIIAWFGQNYDGYLHPKMHPIPIGIANYNWHAGNTAVIREVQQFQFPKIHLAHMSFRAWTHQERGSVVNHFSEAPYCYCTDYKPFDEYLLECSCSKFAISPRGNGLDTHRIWESLFVGTIPVVKSSSLDGLYSDLPVLIVGEWEEVTEELLNEKYKEFSNRKFDMKKLTMDYWTDLIDRYK